MWDCSRQKYLKVTVYILTVCQLVVGVVHLFQGVAHFSDFLIILGISELALACILIYGIVKNSETSIMIYLILGVFGVLTVTVRVFLLLVNDGSEVSGEVIAVLVLALLLAWSTQYSIYLFYRDMVARNRTIAVLSGNVVACHDTVIYNDNTDNATKEPISENTAV